MAPKGAVPGREADMVMLEAAEAHRGTHTHSREGSIEAKGEEVQQRYPTALSESCAGAEQRPEGFAFCLTF